MYLAILGYGLVTIMIIGLLKSKLTPLVAFCILPPIFGMLAGYNLIELADFVVTGVSGTLNSAALCLFATTYFGIMTEKGLFDPAVNFLSKKAGGNVVAITVITSLIAAISHMDTGMTSTMLVTIPAMLPIYKRFKIRPEIMFLLIAQSVAVINLLPHGGGMVRVSGVTGLDISLIFSTIAPVIPIMMIYNVAFAFFIGKREKVRIAAGQNAAVYDNLAESDRKVEIRTVKIDIRYVLNLVLTILILVAMFMNLFRSYFVFMMGLGLALIINYKTVKEQNDAIKQFAANAYPIGVIMLASGILVGIMGDTGMLEAMAGVIIRLIPEGLKSFYSIIIGFLSLPLSMALGADGFYYGLTPLFVEVGTSYGVPVISMASIMILARDAVGCITPVSAVSYLAPGLLGVELKDMMKFSFKYLFIFFCVEVVVCLVLGILPLVS